MWEAATVTRSFTSGLKTRITVLWFIPLLTSYSFTHSPDMLQSQFEVTVTFDHPNLIFQSMSPNEWLNQIWRNVINWLQSATCWVLCAPAVWMLSDAATHRHSPWLVVCHPFTQTDESLVSSVDRRAVSVHQDSLMTFGEVQRPETETEVSPDTERPNTLSLKDGGDPVPQSRPESQETLQLKLLWQGCDCGENKHTFRDDIWESLIQKETCWHWSKNSVLSHSFTPGSKFKPGCWLYSSKCSPLPMLLKT